MSNFNPQDFYFHQAKKDWYVARSAYKLEEIDNKFKLFDKNVKTVLDIWCAPGSWLQYTSRRMIALHQDKSDYQIIWLDLKRVNIKLPYTNTYEADLMDQPDIAKIMRIENIEWFDLIISDIAPNTIWVPNIDSMRSIWLLEKTLWLYEKYLPIDAKFAIKIFMWPGFDEFVRDLKKMYWANKIRIFKPKSCRDISKEIYIVKI